MVSTLGFRAGGAQEISRWWSVAEPPEPYRQPMSALKRRKTQIEFVPFSPSGVPAGAQLLFVLGPVVPLRSTTDVMKTVPPQCGELYARSDKKNAQLRGGTYDSLLRC